MSPYRVQVTSTENKLSTLYEYVDDTEDYVEIQQDNRRNQLIKLDLLVCNVCYGTRWLRCCAAQRPDQDVASTVVLIAQRPHAVNHWLPQPPVSMSESQTTSVMLLLGGTVT